MGFTVEGGCLQSLENGSFLIPAGYGPLVAKALDAPLHAASSIIEGTKVLEFAKPRGLVERSYRCLVPTSGEPRSTLLFGLELARYRAFFPLRSDQHPYIYVSFNAGLLSVEGGRRELQAWTERASRGTQWWHAKDELQDLNAWRRYGTLAAHFFIAQHTDMVRISYLHKVRAGYRRNEP